MTAETIKVDAERLQQIGASLDIVANALDAGNDALIDRGALESSLIENALGDFTKAWSDKRSQLITDIRAAAAQVRSFAEQFTAMDTKLGESLGQVGATGTATSGGNAARSGPRASPSGAKRPVGSTPPTTPTPSRPLHPDPVGDPRPPAVAAPTPPRARAPLPADPPQFPEPAVAPVRPRVPDPSEYDPGLVDDAGRTERGFLAGQSEDYSAWMIDEMMRDTGSPWGFDDRTREGPDGTFGPVGVWGPASDWLARADQLGYPHDDNPAAGAVAYWPGSPDDPSGQVGIVRKVNGDGSIVVDTVARSSNGAVTSVVVQPGSANFPTQFLHLIRGT